MTSSQPPSRSASKPTSRPALPKWLAPVFKYGLGLFALAFLIQSGAINPRQLAQAVHGSPEVLVFALGLYMIGNSLAALRWGLLLHTAGVRQPALRIARLHLVGVFFSALLPGGTAGDLAKGFYLFRQDDAKASAHAIASLVMDRITGMLGLLLLTSVSGWLHFKAWRGIEAFYALEATVLAVLCAMLLVLALALRPDAAWLKPLYGLTRKLPGGGFVVDAAQALAVYRGQSRILILSLALSVAVHSLLVGVYITCATLIADAGSNFPWTQHFLIAPMCTLLNGLPLAPAGLGVGEAFGEWVYRLMGMHSGGELLALVHVVVFGMAALSSLAYFFERRK